MTNTNVVNIPQKPQGFTAGGRWAPLTNVLLASRGMERVINRSPNLPGLAVHYGLTGLGKSHAASYCAHKFNGFYVEVRSHYTCKSFAAAILKEMGIRPQRTISEMMEQISEQLDLSQRPLILDEADYLVDKNVLDLVRDIHESARTTILLIGEEQFPGKLYQRSPRFHNRVLAWIPAMGATVEDMRSLAQFYVPGVTVEPDFLDRLSAACEGEVRSICNNLDEVREVCQAQGVKRMTLATWGDRPFNSSAQTRVQRRPR